jgi:hypothetical protein
VSKKMLGFAKSMLNPTYVLLLAIVGWVERIVRNPTLFTIFYTYYLYSHNPCNVVYPPLPAMESAYVFLRTM